MYTDNLLRILICNMQNLKKNLNNLSCFIFNGIRIVVKKAAAFSLIELMISLITISCIAAAFAPVVTKKLSGASATVRSGNQVISDCSQISGGDLCSLCYPGECIVCTRKCQQTQFLNTKTCLCENCSARTDGCARCLATGCYGCVVGKYYDSSSKTCINCPSGKCCPEGATAPQDCQNAFTQAQ